ncbi:hypothetical protein PHLCEN_2v5561 [Hermanssonia centrifuga]|uniref:Uncharacterized protein n=1 Tax=Hermanssonia centrifuga TaxID=98765 RepID=A0A2R6P245_9APHY|nr:hypothetical protein PHLCEN_2v5561 [Hermanssonia centrifuga]
MATRKSGEHVHHCFNYLRQTILCGANPTLEPVVPILGVRSVNAEMPRVCRDWTAVYELVEKNFWGSSVWKGTNGTDAQWYGHPVVWPPLLGYDGDLVKKKSAHELASCPQVFFPHILDTVANHGQALRNSIMVCKVA